MIWGRSIIGGAALLALGACGSPSGQSGGNVAVQDGATAQGGAETAPAPPAPGAGNAMIVADKSRTIALNTQGIAPVGLTLRVKDIEMGSDATILNVSASYGGTDTNNVPLASDATYLQDEQGNKLMLKPPADNPRLNILRGQQMDGQLVFLGAVPAGAKALTLVINNNNPGDDLVAPGLSIPLKLDGAAR